MTADCPAVIASVSPVYAGSRIRRSMHSQYHFLQLRMLTLGFKIVVDCVANQCIYGSGRHNIPITMIYNMAISTCPDSET